KSRSPVESQRADYYSFRGLLRRDQLTCQFGGGRERLLDLPLCQVAIPGTIADPADDPQRNTSQLTSHRYTETFHLFSDRFRIAQLPLRGLLPLRRRGADAQQRC